MPKIYDPITIVFRGEEEIVWASKIRELCAREGINVTLKIVLIDWAKKHLTKSLPTDQPKKS